MIEASRIKALPPLKTNKRSYHLLVSFGLMILAAIMLLSWLFTDESLWQVYVQVRLLPWIGLTAVVLLAPSVYLYYKKNFSSAGSRLLVLLVSVVCHRRFASGDRSHTALPIEFAERSGN
jgi:hypothetical protein